MVFRSEAEAQSVIDSSKYFPIVMGGRRVQIGHSRFKKVVIFDHSIPSLDSLLVTELWSGTAYSTTSDDFELVQTKQLV